MVEVVEERRNKQQRHVMLNKRDKQISPFFDYYNISWLYQQKFLCDPQVFFSFYLHKYSCYFKQFIRVDI